MRVCDGLNRVGAMAPESAGEGNHGWVGITKRYCPAAAHLIVPELLWYADTALSVQDATNGPTRGPGGFSPTGCLALLSKCGLKTVSGA